MSARVHVVSRSILALAVHASTCRKGKKVIRNAVPGNTDSDDLCCSTFVVVVVNNERIKWFDTFMTLFRRASTLRAALYLRTME